MYKQPFYLILYIKASLGSTDNMSGSNTGNNIENHSGSILRAALTKGSLNNDILKIPQTTVERKYVDVCTSCVPSDFSVTKNDNNFFCLEKDNIFVNHLTEFFAFLSLYQLNFKVLLNYFIGKKRKSVVQSLDPSEYKVSGSKYSFKDLVELSAEFSKKEDVFEYLKQRANRELYKQDFKKFMVCVNREKRKVYKKQVTLTDKLKKIKNYEKTFGKYTDKKDPCLTIFLSKFKQSFYNLNQTHHYKGFLALLSFLNKLNGYYNKHLRKNYQESLVFPPAFNKKNIMYCLDNVDLQSDPNFFTCWAIDWLLYLFTIETRMFSLPTFLKDLLLSSSITKMLGLLFSVMHHAQIDQSVLKNENFIKKWVTNFSNLVVNDEYITTFITQIAFCSYEDSEQQNLLLVSLSIENNNEKTEFNHLKSIIYSFFEYCYTKLISSFQDTINTL